MRKKVLSLALALVMCLGLSVPAFAAESKWNLEVPGKGDAETFIGKKTFTLRDCGAYDYDPSIGEEIFYKEDDLQFTAENLCVLAKGDTAVFTYTHNNDYAYSTQIINLTAWSDTDGDGVYDKRTIKINFSDEDDYSDGQNGYADLLPGNKYEVLPVGSAWTGHLWSAFVNRDEEGRHEVRLSADKVLELFGPNTFVGFAGRGIYTSDPAEMDWFILVEGNIQPAQPDGTEAIPTNDQLTVNGELQTPTVYKIDGGNYFKLRDLAVLLNGTSCQFDVGYDAATNSVTATSGQGYTKLDGDMQGPASGSQTAIPSNDKIIVNGQAAQVEVYKIDGGNYFKLRDLGAALGFDVGWDDANKVASITTNG